jgi:RNA polymerase sigma-32 factor
MGTTANQKKLFFGLRRVKSKINAMSEGDLTPEQVQYIATDLGVENRDVIDMNRRLQGDQSLNSPMRDDGEGGEWQDLLADDAENIETKLIASETASVRHNALTDAMAVLNPREVEIFTARRLLDEPKTLEELAEVYAISRERVRQIEARAFEKVQAGVLQKMAA